MNRKKDLDLLIKLDGLIADAKNITSETEDNKFLLIRKFGDNSKQTYCLFQDIEGDYYLTHLKGSENITIEVSKDVRKLYEKAFKLAKWKPEKSDNFSTFGYFDKIDFFSFFE